MAIVKIAAKNVNGIGVQVQHLYITYTNDAGVEHVLRGGPENSDLRGTLMGNIQVQDQPYGQSLDFDQNGSHIKKTIWTGTDAEMGGKLAAARAKMNDINSQGFDYNLPLVQTVLPSWPVHNNQNSNTVASSLANAMGLGTEVEQFVQDNNLNVPGFSAPLEHSNYDRSTDALANAITDAGLSSSQFTQKMAALSGQTVDETVQGSKGLVQELIHAVTQENTKANSWGDPHLVTFDGLSYDFQMPGEHVLVASKTDDFQIQTRTELMPGSASLAYNTAAATSLSGTTVGLYLPPRIPGRLYGSLENDRLQATADTALVLGGQDTGTAQVATAADVTCTYAHGTNNVFGYYVKDASGNPTSGQIVWADTRAAVGRSFNYGVDIPKEQLGFFLISDGFSTNRGLANGDPVTFREINGAWTVLKNNTALTSRYTGTSTPAPAFYSDTRLNADRVQHQRYNGDQQGWEDLYNGGDRNYNDIIIRTSLSERVVTTSGDTLVGGAQADHFGYVMGSDGVDKIERFDPTKDRITFYNGANSTIRLMAVGSGTFIQTLPANGGTPGGILLEDVAPSVIASRISFDNTTAIQSSPLYIAGKEVQMKSGELRAVGNGLIYRENNQYTVINEGGDGFVAEVYGERLDIRAFLSPNRPKNSISGLLGTNDNNPDNDLSRRDGTVLGTQVTAAELYGAFADDWRVKPEQSLFAYKDGQNTGTFTDPSFTKKYLTAKDFDADAVVAVRAKVANAGYNESSPLFNNMLLEQLAGGINISRPIGVSERDYARIRDVEVVTPAVNRTNITSSSSSSSSSSTAPFDSGDTGYTGGYTGGYIPSSSSSSSSTGNGNYTLPGQADDTSRGLGTGAIVGIVAGAAAALALIAFLTRRWRRKPAAPAQAEVPPSKNNNGRSEAGVEMAEQAAAPVVNPSVAESGKSKATISEPSECPSVVVPIRDEAKSSEGAHVAALNRPQSPVLAADRSANVAPHTSQVARLVNQPLVGVTSRGV